MSPPVTCSRCGARIHAQALDGLCPACVGRGILRFGSPPADLPAEEPNGTGTNPGGVTKPNQFESEGPRIAGFRLAKQLGEGGFGVVYLAEQLAPVKRQVALKVVKLGMDTRQVVARFEAERQALALMDHPGIARVFDAGATESGRPYFVMEFVAGVPITQYADQQALTICQRLELFMRVCEAVQHAHQKGVIHRDLKPSNILVSVRDGQTVPKVIDFGLAKATQVELTDKTLVTHFQQFLGTPAYMSPEQVGMGAVDVDTRSDIYSLGVLLYELLTGKPPFEGEQLLRSGIDELRRTICETDALRPSTRLRQLPPGEQSAVAGFRATEPPRLISSVRGDLDWIVLKALEKDRVRRYESAGALAVDVRRHLDHEPVAARPPSGWDAFQKLVRRNRTFFFSAFTTAIALVVGLGIATVLFFREREARQRAVQAEQTQSQLRREADGSRELAQAKTEETRRQLVLLNVSTGNKLVASGDYHAALLWFVEAMRLDQGDPLREDLHRRRIASVQRFAPRLIHLGFLGTPVAGAEFTADSRRVIAMGDQERASVWDIESGGTLTNGVSYSPDLHRLGAPPAGPNRVDAEGKRSRPHPGLRSTSDGLAVHDLVTGSEIGQFVAPTNRFRETSIASDGRRAFAIAPDYSIYRWEWPGRHPLEPPLQFLPRINRSTLSGDGRLFAALLGNLPPSVGVWDFLSGKQLVLLQQPLGDIYDCQLSPDGKLLALASWDGLARVFDTSTGLPVGDPMWHGRGVGKSIFTPDGQRLATASWDGTARLWNPLTGKPLSPWLHHAGYVPVAAFSPDGTRLMTGGQDETIRVWDVATNRASGRVLTHQGPVMFARFAPDGTRLATGGRDRWVKVWDRTTGQLIVSNRLSAGVSGGAFSPDGRQLAVGCVNGDVRILDPISGAELASLPGHTQEVRIIQFSRDGQRLLSGSHDGTARLWDLASGRAVFPALTHQERILHAEFSPDGRRIATASRDHTAQVWDATTGARVGKTMKHICWVYWAAFSPDGKRVVTAASDTTQLSRNAQIWDAETGEPIGQPMSHRDGVLYSAFSPDGRQVVTGGEDTMAFVWDAATGAALTPPLRHSAYVWRVIFSPDGRLLLTVSMDNTARIWDANSGEPVTPPLRHEGSVTSGEWSSDGREVITHSLDGTARVWDVSPAPGSISELQREAELLSAHRLKLGLGMAPLSPPEMRERWELSRRRP